MKTDKLLTDIELSRVRNIPLGTLRAGRSRGFGPPFIKLGRTVRYRLSDVDKYLDERLVQPGQAA